MEHPFPGIAEKLIRSNENIRNLDVEIARFIGEGKYAVMPNENDKMFLEAIEYHKQRPIPLRFSVLAGEIIHHLRSCLDHLVWQFSTPESRQSTAIEFPILDHEPIEEKSIARYKGKIQGITNSGVRDLIERLQPYNSPDFVASRLSIIHHMDIFDKHRELVLCLPSGGLMLPVDIKPLVDTYKRTHPEATPVHIARKFHSYGKLTPQISFKDFGRREVEPVCQALIELYNTVVRVVGDFIPYA